MAERSLGKIGHKNGDLKLASIATQLGISISTVSRALRNLPGTHPETRDRVKDLAASIGYRSPSSRNAKPETQTNILVLSLGRGDAGDVSYLEGISKASLALGISIHSHHYDPEESHHILDPQFQPVCLRAGEVKGIILLHRWPEEVVTQLTKTFPVVSIVHSYPLAGVDLVGGDDREGMLMLVRHLRSRGHHRIGFFGYCRDMSWARSRYFGYLEAMAGQNLLPRPDDTITVSLGGAQSFQLVEMEAEMAKVMDRIATGVTAWVASSEMLAHSLCNSLRERGVAIPGQVAVTGYHMMSHGVFGLPRLTSTQIASRELGATALRRLITRLDNPGETRRSILLPAEFVKGEST